ncbi:MAG: hypothetical protein OEV10_01275 [Gammaproteobacteria bacterium]|jgi:hypothetical protein|nr:hypothetical protein [Gammaproteobacteria bacterium]MDH3848122.1 hypothetical protein [Gammaproteobacteria bacterium]MDH3862574.1 hypothetical protein [Gammaproteobacteria bacterium]MDH3904372.1 hypothetical protein [Gammaproteobacteria bacterium]MDH3907895.1 hypothetical protein [Gammaproteobacteria bacterium]
MTIDRITAESAPNGNAHNPDSDAGDTPAIPRQQLDLLALEIEDDDLGSDPYNRTGQFYLAELKKRDQ